MANKVEICGCNTSRLPLYSESEMREMLIAIKDGDKNIREKFIIGNLRLVLSVIQKFNTRGESPDDLFQVGCIGLIKAIENFDLRFDVKFSTYAVPMIMGELRRYLRDNNSIRISRSLRDMAYKAMSAKEALINTHGKEPTIAEIAKEIEAEEEDVVMALDSIAEPVSLFEPVFHDDGDALYVMDQVRDVKNTDDKWLENISLSEAMKKLTPRERNIIQKRYFEGKTQMEIADEISISQAQVSRLEKNALIYMKKFVR